MFSVLVFETRLPYVAQAGLYTTIPLPQFPEYLLRLILHVPPLLAPISHFDREPLILKLKGKIKDGCFSLLEMHCFFYSSGISPRTQSLGIWGRTETERLCVSWKQNFNSSLIITKGKDGCPEFLDWK